MLPDSAPVVLPLVLTPTVRLPVSFTMAPTAALPSCSWVMPKLPALVLSETICRLLMLPPYTSRSRPAGSTRRKLLMIVPMPMVPAVRVDGLPSQPLVMKPLPL